MHFKPPCCSNFSRQASYFYILKSLYFSIFLLNFMLFSSQIFMFFQIFMPFQTCMLFRPFSVLPPHSKHFLPSSSSTSPFQSENPGFLSHASPFKEFRPLFFYTSFPFKTLRPFLPSPPMQSIRGIFLYFFFLLCTVSKISLLSYSKLYKL